MLISENLHAIRRETKICMLVLCLHRSRFHKRKWAQRNLTLFSVIISPSYSEKTTKNTFPLHSKSFFVWILTFGIEESQDGQLSALVILCKAT